MKSKGRITWKKSYFESLDYVAYQKGEPVLRQWFSHHLKRRKIDLNVRAWVMDVHGVAQLLGHGAGAGVLPANTYNNLKTYYKNLIIIGESRKPVMNEIHLAHLRGRSFSRPAQFVIEEIRKQL